MIPKIQKTFQHLVSDSITGSTQREETLAQVREAILDNQISVGSPLPIQEVAGNLLIFIYT